MILTFIDEVLFLSERGGDISVRDVPPLSDKWTHVNYGRVEHVNVSDEKYIHTVLPASAKKIRYVRGRDWWFSVLKWYEWNQHSSVDVLRTTLGVKDGFRGKDDWRDIPKLRTYSLSIETTISNLWVVKLNEHLEPGYYARYEEKEAMIETTVLFCR